MQTAKSVSAGKCTSHVEEMAIESLLRAFYEGVRLLIRSFRLTLQYTCTGNRNALMPKEPRRQGEGWMDGWMDGVRTDHLSSRDPHAGVASLARIPVHLKHSM